jgi:hypothetical protein
MAKIGRNDRCPCGSGKKYKHCCMARDEAATRERLAAAATATTATATAQHDPHLCDDCNEQLDTAANAVLALIDARKFAEAEQAAYEMLARFPAVHDGYECLGRLYQAKGDNHQAGRLATERSSRSLATSRTSTTRTSLITSRT